MSRQFYFTLIYGLPLSIIACSPWPSSCALHSTCRWLQLPPVGDYSPLLYRLTSTPCERPAWPLLNQTLVFFSYCLSFEGLVFSPSIPKLSAMPSICFYTNTFVRSRSAFIWYNPFRRKVSYRYVDLKGRSTFRRKLKKIFLFPTSKKRVLFSENLANTPTEHL